MLYLLWKTLPSDLFSIAQPPPKYLFFFPLEIMNQPHLQQKKNVLGTLKAAYLATVAKKTCQRTWISERWRDTYYFWLPWKISWPSDLDTHKRTHISLLTMFWFSYEGLEHSVILCTVIHTVSELLHCCCEEDLKSFMHYKTSVNPCFTFNAITQHKHRIAQIKLKISNLLSPARWLTT